MKKWDIIIIIGMLFICIMSFGVLSWLDFQGDQNAGALTAQVFFDGDLVKEMPLDQEDTYVLDTKLGHNVIQTKDNGVEMLESDCRDQVCVYTGRVTKPGDLIVCLPNKVVVEIVGEKNGEDEIDALSK